MQGAWNPWNPWFPSPNGNTGATQSPDQPRFSGEGRMNPGYRQEGPTEFGYGPTMTPGWGYSPIDGNSFGCPWMGPWDPAQMGRTTPTPTPFGGPQMGMPPMGPQSMSPMMSPAGVGFTLDPRLITEELRKCARGLQMVAEGLDGPDNGAQYRAHLSATRFLFYSLGLLYARGILLPSDVELGPREETGHSRGASCRAAGIALERFVRQGFQTNPHSYEFSELLSRLRECCDQLGKW